jgi:hypothetical protein
MGEPTSEVLSPKEIRAQVDRMTASSVFSGSPQLGAFLRFVVESVLDGNSARIKAYTIGVEVLRRDAKFDPQIDPIVRVEATRLRRTIDRYYADLGGGDVVRIDVPRGSYVPTFKRRAVVSDAPMQLRAPPMLDRLPGLRMASLRAGAGPHRKSAAGRLAAGAPGCCVASTQRIAGCFNAGIPDQRQSEAEQYFRPVAP